MKKRVWKQFFLAVYLCCLPIMLFAEQSPNYYNGYNYGYSKGMNDEIVISPSKDSNFNSGANEGYWDAQERLRQEKNEEWQRQQEQRDTDFKREMEDLDRQTDDLINDMNSNPPPQQSNSLTPEEVQKRQQEIYNRLQASNPDPSIMHKAEEEERRKQDRQADIIFGGIMGAAGVIFLFLIYKIIRKRRK